MKNFREKILDRVIHKHGFEHRITILIARLLF